MGRIAFVFPGQGAQYSGMGRELAEQSAAAAEIFRLADELRPGTSAQCFSGTAEELSLTATTQPCLYAVELAAAETLRAAGVVPEAVAGFSLGEIAALAFSGAVSTADGFSLVCRRGELMQAAAEQTETAMAAVLRLSDEEVERLCATFDGVYPVNYNCPGQISVAGRKEQMAEFAKAVKAAGGRAVPLRVQGGFHSVFMDTAAAGFDVLLGGYELAAPQMTLYSDFTGLPAVGDLRTLLARQINHPVRWRNIVSHLAEQGFDTFVEVGPGNTLSGLIARILPEARTFGVADAESLAKTLEALKPC